MRHLSPDRRRAAVGAQGADGNERLIEPLAAGLGRRVHAGALLAWAPRTHWLRTTTLAAPRHPCERAASTTHRVIQQRE